MSIRSLIQAWTASGKLTHLTPLVPSSPQVRAIYAADEVMIALNGPWSSREEERRLGRARADLDTFVEGTLMSVRVPPSKKVRAQLALLADRSHEVWEVRVRDPRPGVRLFGRFAEKDCLILLTLAFRENLGTDADFAREMERCKREWRAFFPTHHPHSGGTAHDYVSNAFLV